MTKSRQQLVLEWAVANFGPVAANPVERAARCVEEAIEVAQSLGLPFDILLKIADRVYKKPVGEISQEIGGLFITMEALAEVVGVNTEACGQREFERVISLPKEHWTRRHADKVASGTANLEID